MSHAKIFVEMNLHAIWTTMMKNLRSCVKDIGIKDGFLLALLTSGRPHIMDRGHQTTHFTNY
jgi:hypothetical protein